LAVKKVNYDEMDGDRLRLPANRDCYRLSRVSRALLKLLVLLVVECINWRTSYRYHRRCHMWSLLWNSSRL